MLVQSLDVFTIPFSVSDWLFVILEHSLALEQEVTLLNVRLLVFAGNHSIQVLEKSVNMLKVLSEELVCNDL